MRPEDQARSIAAFGRLYAYVAGGAEIIREIGVWEWPNRRFSMVVSTVIGDDADSRVDVRITDGRAPALAGHHLGNTVDVYLDGLLLRRTSVLEGSFSARTASSAPNRWRARIRDESGRIVDIAGTGAVPTEIQLVRLPDRLKPRM